MPFVGSSSSSSSNASRKRHWELVDKNDDNQDGGCFRRPYGLEDQESDLCLLDAAAAAASTQLCVSRKLASKRARITANDTTLGRDMAVPRRRAATHIISSRPQPSDRSATADKALLAPCHICHRRPTKQSDLDSFAQCQGCGQRACFVCLRQCHGWNLDDDDKGMSVITKQEVLSCSWHAATPRDNCHNRSRQLHRRDGNAKGWAASGHRSVVCSGCCVERGQQGDVVCLGCLSGMPGA